MKLYLSSLGIGNSKGELRKWISQHGNKIALIPDALDMKKNRDQIVEDIDELEDFGFDVNLVSLQKYIGNNDNLKKDLEEYNAFFAIGGNVFRLRKAMQLSGFDKYLTEISKKDDYLYGGYSAGICVLAKKLDIYKMVDPPINSFDNSPVEFEGIGLLDYLPMPHYKSYFPVGKAIDKLVDYCNRNGRKFRVLRDGESWVEDTLEKGYER